MNSLAIKFEIKASDDVELRARLIAKINELILNDFSRLVQLLYQVDVDELKLRSMLHENKTTDSAEIITDLLIERERKRLLNRERPGYNPDIPDDEKW